MLNELPDTFEQSILGQWKRLGPLQIEDIEEKHGGPLNFDESIYDLRKEGCNHGQYNKVKRVFEGIVRQSKWEAVREGVFQDGKCTGFARELYSHDEHYVG